MSQGTVEILDTSQLSLTHLSPPPSPIKLSFFDSIWIAFPPIQRLLLYSNTNLPFSTILRILKSSLASTLLQYYPLAGKLCYLSSTGDVVMDVSDPTVNFIEAKSNLDIHRLVDNVDHDTSAFVQLVPTVDAHELPAPVFAVQVTRFESGGVAVGYSAHHTVADGKAIWEFIEAWAAACSAEVRGELVFECRTPLHDRTMIRHPRGEEIAREFLRTASPGLPTTASPALSLEGRHKLARRTFHLTDQSIQSLKQLCRSCHVNTPSTFLAISVHSWSCFVRSKPIEPDQDSILAFLADCRTRLDPSVHEGYFGNCVRLVYASLPARELTDQDNGLANGCVAVSNTIRKTLKDPLSDLKDWIDDFGKLPLDRVANVSASPRFRVYEITDFGWGRPDRVELVSMNHDGEIALVGSKDGNGVQVTVALDPLQIDNFAKFFLGVICN